MAEATDNLRNEENHQQTRTGVDTDAHTDEPSLVWMLLKDAAIVFAALSLWAAADTWHQVTGLWLAQVVAVGDAVLVGLLLAFLFHEWGHYGGAVASGAVTKRFDPNTLSFFRFNFTYAENDVRQFHWMTAGGHVLHWSILILLLIMVPLDSLGRIALVSAVFGFIVFATFIEYHIVKDTREGADPETRLQELTRKDIEKAALVGGLAGLFTLAILS